MASQYQNSFDSDHRAKARAGSPQILSYENDGFRDSHHIREKPPLERRFGFQTPATVVGLIIGAIGFALGHHFYYQSLKDTVVQSEDQQSWAIRLGTGAAVFTKTALVALIGIAAVQRIWATLRRKAMTLRGIDGMWGIMGDPTWIFNSELLGHAKILMLFAVVSWSIPLITIITPATLSVQSVLTSTITPSPVRTVNFSNPTGWYTYEGPGRIEGPGSEVSRLFTEVYASRRITPMNPPFPNATYDLEFWGPSYKCTPAEEIFATANTPTWNTSDRFFGSPHKTFREAFYAELPIANQSRFRSPSSYIGTKYQAAAPVYMNNIVLLYAEGGPTELVCQLHNTSYSLTISFNNGNQTITPRAITPFSPAAFPAQAGISALLPSAFSGPGPFPANVSATFYATHLLFRNLLVANITLGSQGILSFNGVATKPIPLADSAIPFCPDVAEPFQDVYFDGPAACRSGSLARAVEDLSRNFTLSTLTYQFWDDGNATTTVDMQRIFPQNRYAYQAQTLWITYAVGFFVTALCLVLGGMAMVENGVTSSTAFSTVMLTTRNRDLDVLARDRELGSKPLSDDIARVRMRFGYLMGDEGEGGHVGCGLDGTVVPMGKDK